VLRNPGGGDAASSATVSSTVLDTASCRTVATKKERERARTRRQNETAGAKRRDKPDARAGTDGPARRERVAQREQPARGDVGVARVGVERAEHDGERAGARGGEREVVDEDEVREQPQPALLYTSFQTAKASLNGRVE